MAAPPVVVGAVQETVADALPAVAVAPVGADETADGTALLEGAEVIPMPRTFTAVTLNV